MARMIALAMAKLIKKIGFLNLPEEKQKSISSQRAAMILVNLTRDLISFIISPLKKYRDSLKKRFKILINELYDPNYRKRDSTMALLVKTAGMVS